jgi:hypothetical protein
MPRLTALPRFSTGFSTERRGLDLRWCGSVCESKIMNDAVTLWQVVGLIMAHVGGGFFYLAAHAVLGEMLKHGKNLF